MFTISERKHCVNITHFLVQSKSNMFSFLKWPSLTSNVLRSQESSLRAGFSRGEKEVKEK